MVHLPWILWPKNSFQTSRRTKAENRTWRNFEFISSQKPTSLDVSDVLSLHNTTLWRLRIDDSLRFFLIMEIRCTLLKWKLEFLRDRLWVQRISAFQLLPSSSGNELLVTQKTRWLSAERSRSLHRFVWSGLSPGVEPNSTECVCVCVRVCESVCECVWVWVTSWCCGCCFLPARSGLQVCCGSDCKQSELLHTWPLRS